MIYTEGARDDTGENLYREVSSDAKYLYTYEKHIELVTDLYLQNIMMIFPGFTIDNRRVEPLRNHKDHRPVAMASLEISNFNPYRYMHIDFNGLGQK